MGSSLIPLIPEVSYFHSDHLILPWISRLSHDFLQWVDPSHDLSQASKEKEVELKTVPGLRKSIFVMGNHQLMVMGQNPGRWEL